MSGERKRRGTRRGRKGKGRRPDTPAQASGEYTSIAPERIRPTPDPAAVLRSLGDPPLTPDTAAEHHLAAVYEEAVRAATALAAANGLLEIEDEGEGTGE